MASISRTPSLDTLYSQISDVDLDISQLLSQKVTAISDALHDGAATDPSTRDQLLDQMANSSAQLFEHIHRLRGRNPEEAAKLSGWVSDDIERLDVDDQESLIAKIRKYRPDVVDLIAVIQGLFIIYDRFFSSPEPPIDVRVTVDGQYAPITNVPSTPPSTAPQTVQSVFPRTERETFVVRAGQTFKLSSSEVLLSKGILDFKTSDERIIDPGSRSNGGQGIAALYHSYVDVEMRAIIKTPCVKIWREDVTQIVKDIDQHVSWMISNGNGFLSRSKSVDSARLKLLGVDRVGSYRNHAYGYCLNVNENDKWIVVDGIIRFLSKS